MKTDGCIRRIVSTTSNPQTKRLDDVKEEAELRKDGKLKPFSIQSGPLELLHNLFTRHF